MDMNLTVSVCLASYNGEKYIVEQIESIMQQLTLSDELIVSDDGSKDNTIEIIKKMQSKYPNIKLISGPKMGFSCNFGNAAASAEGDIIMFSDQDDIWMQNKVAIIRQYFQSHSKCTTVLHKMATFSSDPSNDTDALPISYQKGVLRNYIKSCYWGCCMAVRRDFLKRFIPFRDYCVGHDQLTGLMSEKYGKTIFINKKLIKHRIHDLNTSHRRTIVDMAFFRIELLKDYHAAKKRWKSNLNENEE